MNWTRWAGATSVLVFFSLAIMSAFPIYLTMHPSSELAWWLTLEWNLPFRRLFYALEAAGAHSAYFHMMIFSFIAIACAWASGRNKTNLVFLLSHVACLCVSISTFDATQFSADLVGTWIPSVSLPPAHGSPLVLFFLSLSLLACAGCHFSFVAQARAARRLPRQQAWPRQLNLFEAGRFYLPAGLPVAGHRFDPRRS